MNSFPDRRASISSPFTAPFVVAPLAHLSAASEPLASLFGRPARSRTSGGKLLVVGWSSIDFSLRAMKKIE
jgi:hypothetical protein